MTEEYLTELRPFLYHDLQVVNSLRLVLISNEAGNLGYAIFNPTLGYIGCIPLRDITRALEGPAVEVYDNPILREKYPPPRKKTGGWSIDKTTETQELVGMLEGLEF